MRPASAQALGRPGAPSMLLRLPNRCRAPSSRAPPPGRSAGAGAGVFSGLRPAARRRPALVRAEEPGSDAPAEQEEMPEIGGYTPASYISFSEDPQRVCHHHAEVVVDAPIDACYSLWADWPKLIDFLDLIGQIGLDPNVPDMALFQCFYRFHRLPLMELVFLLERTEVQQNSRIAFQSVSGMPLNGEVRLQEQADGATRVHLYFSHPVPNLLVQLQLGPFALETDMGQILAENMAAFKQQAEALAPPDWPALKAAAAKRGAAAEQQQQQQQQQQPAQAAAAQPLPAVQQQQAQQPPLPVAAGTPSAGSKAAPEAAAAAAGAAGDGDAAAGAAKGKPRSRAGTSARKTSAASAAAEEGSKGGARRRSRSATASTPDNGKGGGAGKPGRRSSRRTASAAGQEQQQQ